jgi:NhaP-type Na+/H+ or K+/H+ antiporter
VRGRWAGAMRGAVSVALVYFYYDPDGGSVDAEKSTLIAMTLTVVLFSTLVFGAATKPLLDLMLGPDRARPRAARGAGGLWLQSAHKDVIWGSCSA